MHDANDIKQAVRDRYAGAAMRGGPGDEPATRSDLDDDATASAGSCCGPAPAAATTASCGCGGAPPAAIGGTTERSDLGYSPDELAAVPDGADLGLGCGNPLAMLDLREGETVLDLGSGGGIDCFIAAKRVGANGHVIGVDMTPEMVDRARRNAAAAGAGNVEFRLGEIENLPVADSTVDAIISNCVINLVPDKRRAFAEAFRVLRPGGRLSVSDIVLTAEVPFVIRDSVEAYVACLSGAIMRDDYLAQIADAGFTDVRVTSEKAFSGEDAGTEETVAELRASTGATTEQLKRAATSFASVRVSARKPS
jgi:arsenite methyltransferase